MEERIFEEAAPETEEVIIMEPGAAAGAGSAPARVYVKADGAGRIVRCEGGYTTPEELDGWVLIDEGVGDRYNLCQAHYFDGGLFTWDGIPRWRLADGVPVLRGEDELEADRAAIPAPGPAAEEIMLELLADHEYRLCMAELEGGAIL